MPTECSADLFGFERVEGRAVVAGFDGGKITSDAGGLLLGVTDRAIGLIDRFAQCFSDARSEELVATTRSWRCWRANLPRAARTAHQSLASRRSTGWNWARTSRRPITRSATTRRRSKPRLSICL